MRSRRQQSNFVMDFSLKACWTVDEEKEKEFDRIFETIC